MKLLLTVILFLITFEIPAPPNRELVIVQVESINPYEAIIKAVVKVESNNGKYLFNAKENAVGYFGIRPIRLRDYNERTGKNVKLSECYDYQVGRAIFLFYVSQIDYRDIKTICRDWNGRSKRNLYYQKILKVYEPV